MTGGRLRRALRAKKKSKYYSLPRNFSLNLDYNQPDIHPGTVPTNQQTTTDKIFGSLSKFRNRISICSDLHNLKGRHHLWSSRYLQPPFKWQVSWNDYVSNMCKCEIFPDELFLINTFSAKSLNLFTKSLIHKDLQL